MSDIKSKMNDAIEHLKKQYRNLRTNRINPHMLDDITIDMYGSKMNIKSLATITVQERSLVLTPFDPSSSGTIAKAIEDSPLQLQAVNEKKTIRVPIPPLTEELRKTIVKEAKKITEGAKVTIRDIRRKGNEQLKSEKSSGEITEDDLSREEKTIQSLTDTYCKQIDQLYTDKEKDILTI